MEREYTNLTNQNQRDSTAYKRKLEYDIHRKPSSASTSFKRPYTPPRKPEQKNHSPLPELGQPGGRDDPLRRGLSGAGVRWYLRYLSQGLAPEEARKRAEAHRIKSGQRGTSPIVYKRKLDESVTTEISPKRIKEEEPEKERESIVSSLPSDAKKIEKIAILPKAYPDIILSANDQTILEEAIVEEMFEGWDHKIQFKAIHFRPGMILVECDSPHSAEWLRLKVPKLKNWNGVELKTCDGDTASRPIIASIFFPRCQGHTPEKLLKLVEVQNEGVKASTWNVLNVKDGEKGQLLRVGIDEASHQTIKNNGYSIHYRFGKIPVHGLKKQERGAEEPTPGTSKDESKSESEIESVAASTPQTSVTENSHP